MKVGKDQLRRKLERVEALRERATAPGERAAATAASARLRRRLEKLGDDPVAAACARELEDLGELPEVVVRGRPSPSENELVAVLDLWEGERWGRERVSTWARDIVDRAVLPDDPLDPRSRVSEVLMNLADMDSGGFRIDDIPAARVFLGGGGWDAWFDLLAVRARGVSGG